MLMSVTAVAADTAGPLASAGALPMVNAGGDGTYTFTVTYNDPSGVLRSSIGGNDVLVVGPNGFEQLAQLISVSGSGNEQALTATYRITIAGGAWTLAHNGTYTVSMNGSAVSDVNSNASAGGTLGTFAVSVPGPDYAGNDRYHARNIQAFNPGRTAVYRDYVSAATDIQDYYRFKVNVLSVVSIKIYELTADASLQIRALDHKLIKSSTRAGTRYELISIALPPGSYYARVIGAVDVQTPYAIRVAVTALPAAPVEQAPSVKPLSMTSALTGVFTDAPIMGPFPSDSASELLGAM